jgi:signal transduction histidine kinase
VTRLRRLLTAPVFEDESQTHQAYMLHVVLWALIVVPVPYVAFTALVAPASTGRAVAESAAGEAANLVLLWLLRAGRLSLAASLQVLAFFAFFTVLSASGGGVRGPAYLLGYGLTIVIAGALLGGRGALAVTVAAVAVGGVLVACEAPEGPPERASPLFYWGLSALLFPFSALVQDLASRAVRRALARARSSEAQYRALVAELELKNAELERFTYTVSHDLKSPLITLRGLLGYMEADARAGNLERLMADIGRIVEATDKMRRLLDELLELSRIGRLVNPPRDVPFAEIAREALELVRGRLDARGVRVEVAPGLPVVRGDRARLVEVVQNLVDNAGKFMGGEPQPRVEIGARVGADPVVLFVRDNGIGVAPQHRERVFRLFDKLDPDGEGTGVGLALAKRIVELHGGRIWVEAAQPKGSSFCFTLPRAAAPVAS